MSPKPGDWLPLDPASPSARRLYIPTGQYSSLCVSAVVLTLGGEEIVEAVQEREQVDSEREKVEVRDEEKETKREQTTHAETYDIMDGMWMDWLRTWDTLSHDVSVITCARCMRKNHVWGVSAYTLRRLQWIATDCKRNQL